MVSKLRIMNTIVWFLPGNRLKVEEYEPIVWLLQGNRLKVADYEYHCMGVPRKSSQSCGWWIPLHGSYKEIVSKLRIMNTMVWSLQGYHLKVAEYHYHRMVARRNSLTLAAHEYHCMVVTRKCLKVAEYEYHFMVITRKSSQNCRIWIPLYGSYKEMVSKLRIMNTIVWFLQGNRLKVEEYEPILWLLHGNCLKGAEYEYHCMVLPRKSSQS